MRRKGQTTSFAFLAKQLQAKHEENDELPSRERIERTVAHFDKDAEKYMQLVRNVDQLASSGRRLGVDIARVSFAAAGRGANSVDRVGFFEQEPTRGGF